MDLRKNLVNLVSGLRPTYDPTNPSFNNEYDDLSPTQIEVYATNCSEKELQDLRKHSNKYVRFRAKNALTYLASMKKADGDLLPLTKYFPR